MKWNCTGVNERIEQIKEFLNTSRKTDKNFIAYRALKELDRTISTLLEDSENDPKYLMSYRRQVRTLLKTVTQ